MADMNRIPGLMMTDRTPVRFSTGTRVGPGLTAPPMSAPTPPARVDAPPMSAPRPPRQVPEHAMPERRLLRRPRGLPIQAGFGDTIGPALNAAGERIGQAVAGAGDRLDAARQLVDTRLAQAGERLGQLEGRFGEALRPALPNDARGGFLQRLMPGDPPAHAMPVHQLERRAQALRPARTAPPSLPQGQRMQMPRVGPTGLLAKPHNPVGRPAGGMMARFG